MTFTDTLICPCSSQLNNTASLRLAVEKKEEFYKILQHFLSATPFSSWTSSCYQNSKSIFGIEAQGCLISNILGSKAKKTTNKQNLPIMILRLKSCQEFPMWGSRVADQAATNFENLMPGGSKTELPAKRQLHFRARERGEKERFFFENRASSLFVKKIRKSNDGKYENFCYRQTDGDGQTDGPEYIGPVCRSKKHFIDEILENLDLSYIFATFCLQSGRWYGYTG